MATAPLTVQMFGPMQVLVGDEPLPPLRSRKALWLLALLALRGGRAVAREWLAGTLWPDADQSVAYANLRPVICELRRALGEQRFRIHSPNRVTIVLDLQDADVDVVAFDAALLKGDFQAATRLYAGTLLEGCPEEWVAQEQNVREKEFSRALQTLADAHLAKGDFDEAIRYYQRLIATDPWRDAARRGLMRALTESGDINAALQTYRDYAHVLRTEGGLSPDEKTTDLYGRLREQVQQKEKRVTLKEPALPAEKVLGYLPHALTALVGREVERTEVAEALRQHRLVTLKGPGGMGKTRLAIEVAAGAIDEFPDGVWLVSMENLNDGGRVVAHVLDSLGIPAGAERSGATGLSRALKGKRALLVLDNCEHLVASVVDLCARLLRDCGGVRILVTSRESLGMLGERVWTTPPLPVPDPAHLSSSLPTPLRVVTSYDGVRLFVDRAKSIHPPFEITPANAADVAGICARLEGVPLAIELAAGRMKSMTPAQVVERMGDPLRLLVGGNRGAAIRQQSFRGTLDWSYALLTSSERRLFVRLSVFTNGWTLEEAEAVCADAFRKRFEIGELQRGLVDKSMVCFDERTGRFRFSEMVRRYAEEKLRERGEKSWPGVDFERVLAVPNKSSEVRFRVLPASGEDLWVRARSAFN